MNIAGIIFFVIFILSFYAGTSYYIGHKLLECFIFLFPYIDKKIFISAYCFIALSAIFVFLPLPTRIKRIISWSGSHWMGIYIYLLLLFPIADIVLSFLGLIRVIPAPIPQSIRFLAGGAVIVVTFAMVIYGIYNAKQIKHVSYHVQTKEMLLADQFRIVLISDIHLGAVNSEKNLSKIVHNINVLKPDIVCIAGDIFNDDYNSILDPEEAVGLLKSISATYGVYASLGNHDGGKTFDQMLGFLERSNIELLKDEHVIIAEQLCLIGRVDSSPIGGFKGLKRKDISEIIAPIDKNMPIIVMDHTPSNFEQYGSEFALVLAGHTHKGQIFPFNLITSAIFALDYGYCRQENGGPDLVVASGVGTWGMPMRVGTNNEIVSIILR